MERCFARGQTHLPSRRKELAYMVAPKAVVRDPLSSICVTQGPDASFSVLGIVGLPYAATILKV